jgi:hypothetical protein
LLVLNPLIDSDKDIEPLSSGSEESTIIKSAQSCLWDSLNSVPSQGTAKSGVNAFV